ncbi:hypothetical protein [Micromonospora globbae]|uniref:hypothetical protein n=1 Tax=Micromonospora globbae TaxID=1894969 RepID=UPI0034405A9E
MRSVVVIGAVLLLGAAVAGCAQPAPAGPSRGVVSATTRASNHGGVVDDQVSLVDNLRQRTVTVEVVGAVEQPFLSVNGTQLRLSGAGLASPATIESYEYDTAAAATQDAEQIDPNGDPWTSKIAWVAPPHFYRAQRLIVLYVGADAGMRLLANLLGPPFAGR